ncbi:MAG: HipA domain-containing protein [Sulfurimonas sp.]|nr:HipA domain-containing protein [Sulfurimonas sp.]
MHLLYIHCDKNFVGTLVYDEHEDKYDLEYTPQWMSEGFAMSPSLDFSGDFQSNTLKNFIENLLPEGKGLEDLSVYFQISKANKFALLRAIGLETTGALTFTHSKNFLPATSFREISEEELKERISIKESVPIHIWDQKPRLSIAGVQEKLPVTILGDKIGLGEGDLCSTHILKFNKHGENVTLNEYISMRLAKELGFNVAEVEYKTLSKEGVLFVKRFDREIISDTSIKRKHIIDSVQALGYRVSFKYERNMGKNYGDIREGVSFQKLFALAQNAVVPIVFKEQIIRFHMLNLILGNSDAHGKNISFFVTTQGLEVAPFYDLVNVSMYKEIYEQEMAMATGDEFDSESLSSYDFEDFFSDNNINKNSYFEEFKSLVTKIGTAFGDFGFIDEKIAHEEKEFIDAYKRNIMQRVQFFSTILNTARFVLPLENETDAAFVKENMPILKRILGKSYDATLGSSALLKIYLEKVNAMKI